jgi:heme-degrading monooxygenase HmoA
MAGDGGAVCRYIASKNGEEMKEISVINYIEVPEGMEHEAERVRETYVDYFRKQKGFVHSILYREMNAVNVEGTRHINIVAWDSYESFQALVNAGFESDEGLNDDGMKVLGKGFPAPIKVSPGQYKVIEV